MLSNTSTEWAPWYVIPADRKWFARICVSAVLAHTLMSIDPHYPAVDMQKLKDLAETKALLEAEAPDGAAADPFEAGLVAEAEKLEALKQRRRSRAASTAKAKNGKGK